MNKSNSILDIIENLAGCQRDKSFRMAAEYAIAHNFRTFIETGCYRGIDADGQSTVILALLAASSVEAGMFLSHDIDPEHIKMARLKCAQKGLDPAFACGDSVAMLSKLVFTVDFAYLDSYDFDANNHLPSQRHQLAEVGAILGKMAKPGLILLDDCDLPHGGKAGMSGPFLEERGWKCVYSAYQKVFIQE
jgi:predicted O-methyltransferase YrrM